MEELYYYSLQTLYTDKAESQSMWMKLPAALKSVAKAPVDNCRCAVTASRRSV